MSELNREADRLFGRMHAIPWTWEECRLYARLTLPINRLKKERNAVILGHSYQTPDILFGIADYLGDSLELSRKAQKTDADVIVFCGVSFMAETAKILSPAKTVLLPDASAGCSLAESITAQDIRDLRAAHPSAAIVAYINTSASVKAEVDVCCTSANALKVVESLPHREIVFVPDVYMAQNLQKLTSKTLIPWRGTCLVHERFSPDHIHAVRERYPGVKILVHTETSPSVVALADLAGGTGDMIRYAQESPADRFMLVTECGLSDRLRAEMPGKEFVGACSLCPYMKRINLMNVEQALTAPTADQIVEVPEFTRRRAAAAVERMLAVV